VPRNADFLAVNVYLESPASFTACLSRLQNLAGNKPLLITEFGLDVAAHGPEKQAEVMRWQHDCLLQEALRAACGSPTPTNGIAADVRSPAGGLASWIVSESERPACASGAL
jgi:hypothetical protein